MFSGSVIFLLASNPLFSNYLVKNLELEFPQATLAKTPSADAIIVLGGGIQPPNFPRRYSQLSNGSNRFWHAARVFKQGKAKKIVLLGGNTYKDDQIKPESYYVKSTLVSLGVPKEAIITETESRTTRENQEKALSIFKQHNIKSALLVTSALHMPRAMKEFKNTQLKITAISSDSIYTRNISPSIFNWIPNANAFVNSTKALHEYYGLSVIKGEESIDDFKDYLKRPAQQTASL